ncbi:DOPA 4,5-dioxygenase family protein [Vibrio palustris]|uniref:Dopa 4,5-dioxygenase family n=1 Tax=Vibrio palustris TaxID=1918946 RepID=A0A1R4B0L6_9VIBR|nr:DOPA 4,5-dioxygenase family protein [Vibrio palustris]SJL82449.1 Dopa 4,5-dioxygenase family [Vibrio palustris]
MEAIKRPVNVHQAYHAHVYFNQDTLEFARDLCHKAGEQFTATIGRVHEKLVGPHTMWSCQIKFSTKVFDDIIPWLEENRNGLTIFVHGLTGDDLADHTTYAYWLGDPVAIDLSGL